MKSSIKRALSLLTALAIVCSFAVIPASAADVTPVIGVRQAGAQSGDTIDVEVYAASGGFVMDTYMVAVGYNSAVLAYVDDSAADVSGLTKTTVEINPTDESVIIGVMSNGDPVSIANGAVLATLSFKVANSTVESQTTELAIVAADTTIENTTTGDFFETEADTAASVPVKGSDPTIGTVTLEGTDSITVTGTQGGSSELKAVSVNGTDITGVVEWSVAPADKGVEVDGSGRITVDPKAEADTYTFTAKGIDGKSLGGPVNADKTLRVERETPVASSVKVEGPEFLVIPSENNTYTARVLDQFGDVMPSAGDIVWTLSPESADGITLSADGKVSVADTAAVGDVVITADCGGVTGKLPVKVVNVTATAAPVKNPTYGMTWAEILPDSGIKAMQGEKEVEILSIERLVDGKEVSGQKPAASFDPYVVTVVANTANGPGTVEVKVNVACQKLVVKADDFPRALLKDGEKVVSAEKTITVSEENLVSGKLFDDVTITIYAEGGDTGSYQAEVTECSNPNYVVELQGGYLPVYKESDRIVYEDLDRTNSTTPTQSMIKNALKEEFPLEALAEKLGLKETMSVTFNGSTIKDVAIKWTIRDDKDMLSDEDAVAFLKRASTNMRDGDTIDFVPVITNSQYAHLQLDAAKLPAVSVAFRTSEGGNPPSGGPTTNGSNSGAAWRPDNRGGQDIVLTPVGVFSDVPETNTFYSDINWCYYRGIMQGTGTGVFSPSRTTNRQQLWMVLARLSGNNPSSMAVARDWAVNNGVSDGTSATNTLSRQQMVTMLYRWALSKGYNGELPASLSNFSDGSSVSSYAQNAMAWAVANGIVTGTSDGRLNPTGTATRGQFAAIMHRFCVKFDVK